MLLPNITKKKKKNISTKKSFKFNIKELKDMIKVKINSPLKWRKRKSENETEGEDVQGVHTFGNHILLVGTKEPGDGLGRYPDGGTGYQHRNRNEPERLGDDKPEGAIIPLTHLDGTERLDGTASAGEEEIVDIEDVHTDGEGKEGLHRIAEDCRGTGREKRQQAIPFPENGQEQKQNEQDQGRQTMVCELGYIFIVRCVEIIRQGFAVLFSGNFQIVFQEELIETGTEGS
jgi:hypothetical protein